MHLVLFLQNINFAYEMDDLSEEFMHKSMDKTNLLTNTMSKQLMILETFSNQINKK